MSENGLCLMPHLHYTYTRSVNGVQKYNMGSCVKTLTTWRDSSSFVMCWSLNQLTVASLGKQQGVSRFWYHHTCIHTQMYPLYSREYICSGCSAFTAHPLIFFCLLEKKLASGPTVFQSFGTKPPLGSSYTVQISPGAMMRQCGLSTVWLFWPHAWRSVQSVTKGGFYSWNKVISVQPD